MAQANDDVTIHAMRVWVTMSHTADSLSPSDDKNAGENRELQAIRPTGRVPRETPQASGGKPHFREFPHRVSVRRARSMSHTPVRVGVPRYVNRGAVDMVLSRWIH